MSASQHRPARNQAIFAADIRSGDTFLTVGNAETGELKAVTASADAWVTDDGFAVISVSYETFGDMPVSDSIRVR